MTPTKHTELAMILTITASLIGGVIIFLSTVLMTGWFQEAIAFAFTGAGLLALITTVLGLWVIRPKCEKCQHKMKMKVIRDYIWWSCDNCGHSVNTRVSGGGGGDAGGA